MRSIIFTALLLTLTSFNASAADPNGYTAQAADPNGYTAQYECRAGGEYCDVDVVALGTRICDQVIYESTPWSSINWSKNTICIAAGDHTSKGTLTIDSSGTSGTRKVLRYYRSGDNDDEPWDQTDGNKAKISKLVINANYWIIHRLTFPSIDQTLRNRLGIKSPNNNVIISRILVEGMADGFTNAYTGVFIDCCDASSITVQNSVIRNSWGKLDSAPLGINAEDGTDIHIVNNELYNWSAHPMQLGRNGTPLMPGLVAENNDIYTTSWLHLPDGRARSKSPYSNKARGLEANPIRIIHNRIWGGRQQNAESCCIFASGGHALYIGGSSTYRQEWILVQNNIFMESQVGVGLYNNAANKISFIGNIFQGMRKFLSTKNSHALQPAPQMDNSEVYFNSFIDNEQYGFSFGGSTALDIRCNAFITGGDRQGVTPGLATEADYNVFYDTPSWSFNRTDTIIDKDLNSISGNLCTTLGCVATANTTGRAIGDIVRTSTTPATSCTAANDQDCFLYKAISVGALGQVMAIRGPYAFYRKLLTKPELTIIPYATPYVDPTDLASGAQEAYACPSDYAARPGIGISDDL